MISIPIHCRACFTHIPEWAVRGVRVKEDYLGGLVHLYPDYTCPTCGFETKEAVR